MTTLGFIIFEILILYQLLANWIKRAKIYLPTYRWQRRANICSNEHHRERQHACAAIVYVSSSPQPSSLKPTCPSVGGLTRLVKRPKQVNCVVSYKVTGFL